MKLSPSLKFSKQMAHSQWGMFPSVRPSLAIWSNKEWKHSADALNMKKIIIEVHFSPLTVEHMLVGQWGTLVWLSALDSNDFWKAHQKVVKISEQKELVLIHMVDRREIRYVETYFNLCQWKTDGQIESIIDADVAVCKQGAMPLKKCAGGTSNMSMHMRRHQPLLVLGSPVGNKRKADTLMSVPVWTWNTGTHTGTF